MAFLTIGHSNRSIDDFLELLQEQDISLLIDVRRFPHSRRYPHFDITALSESLRACGMGYEHWEVLGGRRPVLEGSVNTGWRVAGFQGYADYMGTPPFQNAIERLQELGQGQQLALMCAEAVPWQCHRQLIADALLARGARVLDILGAGQVREHTMTSFAVQDSKGLLTYPPSQAELDV
jgi:uncharacterized protein (DUF488 family)